MNQPKLFITLNGQDLFEGISTKNKPPYTNVYHNNKYVGFLLGGTELCDAAEGYASRITNDNILQAEHFMLLDEETRRKVYVHDEALGQIKKLTSYLESQGLGIGSWATANLDSQIVQILDQLQRYFNSIKR